MAGLILPRRFRQQPQQVPPINWGNPITRGLGLAWVASNPNLAQGPSGLPTISSNTLTKSNSVHGVTGTASGSANYLAFSTNAMFLSNTWTSLSVVTVPVANTTAAITTVAASPGSSTVDRSLYLQGGVPYADLYDGSDKNATYGPAITVGVPYVLAASSGGSSIDVWVNGATTSTATSNGGYGYGGTNPQFIVGYGAGGLTGPGATGSSNAIIALQLYWTRALSNAEQVSMAANPYQIFKAPPRRLWALAVAAAAAGRPQVFACT